MKGKTHTGLVVVPTRLGTVGEAYFQRCAVPRGLDIVYFRQVPCGLPGEHCEAFDTLLIDLRPEPDQLFAQVDKGARYEIRRAVQRDNPTFESSHDPSSEILSAFCDAYDGFASAKRLPTISRPLIRAYAAAGVLRITSARDAEAKCVVWHSYLQVTTRVRLLHSVSSYRRCASNAVRAMYGRLNRFLHWRDMQLFKRVGVVTYDMGGWYTGSGDAGRLAINGFKKQFGGQSVREYNCHQVLTWRGHVMLSAEALLKTTSALGSSIRRV